MTTKEAINIALHLDWDFTKQEKQRAFHVLDKLADKELRRGNNLEAIKIRALSRKIWVHFGCGETVLREESK